MSRTVKIVIAVVLAVAAAAVVAGVVGLVMAHNSVVVGPRQIMGANGFRLPGQMGGTMHFFGFGRRHLGAFLALPWFALLLVVVLAAVLLIWRPWQAAPAPGGPSGGPAAAGAASGGGLAGPPAGDIPAGGIPPSTRELFEQWHREMHAQGLAHGSAPADTARTEVTAEPPLAAPQAPVGAPQPPVTTTEPPAPPEPPVSDEGDAAPAS